MLTQHSIHVLDQRESLLWIILFNIYMIYCLSGERFNRQRLDAHNSNARHHDSCECSTADRDDELCSISKGHASIVDTSSDPDTSRTVARTIMVENIIK
jgi:hypothetical protein